MSIELLPLDKVPGWAPCRVSLRPTEQPCEGRAAITRFVQTRTTDQDAGARRELKELPWGHTSDKRWHQIQTFWLPNQALNPTTPTTFSGLMFLKRRMF